MAVDDDTVSIPVIVVEAKLAVDDAVNIPMIAESAVKVLTLRSVAVVVAKVLVPITLNTLFKYVLPFTAKVADGVLVPTPTLPLFLTYSPRGAVDEAMKLASMPLFELPIFLAVMRPKLEFKADDPDKATMPDPVVRALLLVRKELPVVSRLADIRAMVLDVVELSVILKPSPR